MVINFATHFYDNSVIPVKSLRLSYAFNDSHILE